MSLAEELAQEILDQCYREHQPAVGHLCWPGTQLIAAKIDKALTRAARECEKHAEDVDSEHWRTAHRCMAENIKALQSSRG